MCNIRMVFFCVSVVKELRKPLRSFPFSLSFILKRRLSIGKPYQFQLQVKR
ncbi:Uncharacterized protein APZ42_029302 [Daphnia magna]|uniref:Uncharacterized protein n=1 Tax=Daphnia magna TaxID=35525 RepID=A0A164PT76_9CRUS|nr:Uncharacterized protein APZ42_029302 [Daphnia magna]